MLLRVLSAVVLFFACSVIIGVAEKEPSFSKPKKKNHPQKVAMEQWAHYLNPAKDYVPEQWRVMFHSRSESTFFNEYAMILSVR